MLAAGGIRWPFSWNKKKNHQQNPAWLTRACTDFTVHASRYRFTLIILPLRNCTKKVMTKLSSAVLYLLLEIQIWFLILNIPQNFYIQKEFVVLFKKNCFFNEKTFYQSIDITALKKCVCSYEIQSALQCSKCKKYWLMSTVRKVITK